MSKELKILAHQEQVHQLFMNNVEPSNRLMSNRTDDAERKCSSLVRPQQFRRLRHLECELHPLGNMQAQLHSTAWANTRLVGADVGVHGALPVSG